MAKPRELRRRIKSVQSTRKITKTMELVATSKLKRAQDRVVAARPYAAALAEVIGDLYAPDRAARSRGSRGRPASDRQEGDQLLQVRQAAGGVPADRHRRQAQGGACGRDRGAAHDAVRVGSARRGGDRVRAVQERGEHATHYTSRPPDQSPEGN